MGDKRIIVNFIKLLDLKQLEGLRDFPFDNVLERVQRMTINNLFHSVKGVKMAYYNPFEIVLVRECQFEDCSIISSIMTLAFNKLYNSTVEKLFADDNIGRDRYLRYLNIGGNFIFSCDAKEVGAHEVDRELVKAQERAEKRALITQAIKTGKYSQTDFKDIRFNKIKSDVYFSLKIDKKQLGKYMGSVVYLKKSLTVEVAPDFKEESYYYEMELTSKG